MFGPGCSDAGSFHCPRGRRMCHSVIQYGPQVRRAGHAMQAPSQACLSLPVQLSMIAKKLPSRRHLMRTGCSRGCGDEITTDRSREAQDMGAIRHVRERRDVWVLTTRTTAFLSAHFRPAIPRGAEATHNIPVRTLILPLGAGAAGSPRA